jgi:hypothetical protein
VKRRGFLHLLAGAAAAPFASARADDDDGAAAVGPFSFALVGEMFNASEGVAEAERLIAGIGQSGVKFIVDVGAFKSSLERCSDQLFSERAALLDSSIAPLVAVAADNEWTGCEQDKQGGFDPYERLEALRQRIFATPQSLGVNPMSLARQSGMRQFRTFSENTRWQFERVLFITLDAPSPNNDYRLGAGRNGEFEDRVIADREWLERAFRYASSLRFSGIAIAMQADPEFKRPLRPPDHRSPRRDGFYELKVTLRDLTAKFHGQVMLMHAPGSSGFVIDQPLVEANGKVLRNFTRIAAFAAPADKRWLEVRVDTRTPRIFSVRPRLLEDAPAPPAPTDIDARPQT